MRIDLEPQVSFPMRSCGWSDCAAGHLWRLDGQGMERAAPDDEVVYCSGTSAQPPSPSL